MSSALFSLVITLHLRGGIVGYDRFQDPLYDPDEDVPDVPAWWEPAGSEEDVAAAQQVVNSYWVYTEDDRLQAADEVTLFMPHPVRCSLAPPQHQSEGFLLSAYNRVLATVIKG